MSAVADAIVIDDIEGASEEGRFREQGVQAQPAKGSLMENCVFNKKDKKSLFPYYAVDPSQSGVPALEAELLGRFCPNWWHGSLTDLIRSLLSLHCGQGYDPHVLHKLLMDAGQSQVGHYTNFDWLRRLLALLGLETTEADCVLQSVREAAAAIPAMTGREQLICEELHWRYCRR
jgi:hypothetical protein